MINLRNRVNLIGNLGIDPEVKHFDGGKTVANIRIATSDSYKNADGEKVTNTQWHNLVAWGNTALFVEKYLKKGNEIAIEGKLVHRSYEDKEGKKRYVSEIMVNEILMLRSKNDNN